MKSGRMAERRSAALLLAVLLAAVLFGCGQSRAREEAKKDAKKDGLKIVCTIFPEYDWVKQILGERAGEAELTLLMRNGADPHSYQPSVWDMQKIAEADLFVYVGGESERWAEKALADTANPDRKVLKLMDILSDSVREEAHVEGMKEAREYNNKNQDHDQEEPEYDEHVWLSLRSAQTVCRAVAEALGALEEAYRDVCERNSEAYCRRLQSLDEAYRQAAKQAEAPALLFGDRFPFRYLADDYGLVCYAAFAGCSAETEADFSVIIYLAEKAEELALPVILAIDGSDQRVARTIAQNSGTGERRVLTLDSMQSVSAADIAAGADYLGIMERNLEVVKEALAVRGGE